MDNLKPDVPFMYTDNLSYPYALCITQLCGLLLRGTVKATAYINPASFVLASEMRGASPVSRCAMPCIQCMFTCIQQ